MIDKRLKAEIIPAAVLLNNFISNGKDSNYEFYLLEYLNQSQFFQEKSIIIWRTLLVLTMIL